MKAITLYIKKVILYIKEKNPIAKISWPWPSVSNGQAVFPWEKGFCHGKVNFELCF